MFEIGKPRMDSGSGDGGGGAYGSAESPTREDVVEAWRKISVLGYGNPAETDVETRQPLAEEIQAANSLYDAWMANELSAQPSAAALMLLLSRGKRSPYSPSELEALWRVDFESATLFIDAGFTGADYLEAVANDRLARQEAAAEYHGFGELAKDIKAKRIEINQQLGRVGIAGTD